MELSIIERSAFIKDVTTKNILTCEMGIKSGITVSNISSK